MVQEAAFAIIQCSGVSQNKKPQEYSGVLEKFFTILCGAVAVYLRIKKFTNCIAVLDMRSVYKKNVMLRKRFFFYNVILPRAVDFYISRTEGVLYMSGWGGVKSVELFDCFYRQKGQGSATVLALKFFNRRLFRGVFIAAGVICRDFFWGFFFELYVYGPGFGIFW